MDCSGSEGKSDENVEATKLQQRVKIKFSRLKNLTRHFVHTEPFYIFGQFTRNCRTVIKIASLDLLLFGPY